MTSILLTGAAGFLGSNVLKMLNVLSIRHILAVDDLSANPNKFKNLVDGHFSEYLTPEECKKCISSGQWNGKIQSIIHLGNTVDYTASANPATILQNNYRYSIDLYEFAASERIPFIYASSAAAYGTSHTFIEDQGTESPTDLYAYSKYLFDQYVLSHHDDRFPAVGLRFFTLYGQGEFFKNHFASIAYKAYKEYQSKGYVNVMIPSEPSIQQKKTQHYSQDFVYVDDAVKVLLFFLNEQHSGIFNVGTGKSTTFDEVVATVINTIRASRGSEPMSIETMRDASIIRHIPTPLELKGRIQVFTEAHLKKLHSAGFTQQMMDPIAGIEKYTNTLIHHEHAIQ